MLPETKDIEAAVEDYCRAFGTAGAAVRKYVEYWRQHHRETISKRLPALDPPPIVDLPVSVYRHTASIYPGKALRESAAFLHEAATEELTEQQKMRLESLLLGHEHTRMLIGVLQALYSSEDNPAKMAGALAAARKLDDFRQEFASVLGAATTVISQRERALADITALEYSKLFELEKITPYMRIGPEWYLVPGTGETDGPKPTDMLNAKTKEIRTWPLWMDKTASNLDPGTKEIWLATTFRFGGDFVNNKYALNFWALTRPAAVYLNGKLLAELPASEFIDTPFAAWQVHIPPDAFDVARHEQALVVRLDLQPRIDSDAAWRALWLSETTPDN